VIDEVFCVRDSVGVGRDVFRRLRDGWTGVSG